jgi:uridine phosphorylase
MEAAALYAFAKARNKPVICYAMVTNQMAVSEGDFEKGEAAGATTFLRMVKLTHQALTLDEQP